MRRTFFWFLGLVLGSFFAGCGRSNSPQQTITVMVAPPAVSVALNQQQTFTATVSGTTNTAVTWSVAGGAANGAITSTGIYTAPSAVPASPQVTVTGGNTTTGTISTSGLYSAPHSVSNSLIPANGAPVTVQITAISTANPSNLGTATVTLTVPNQSAEGTPVNLGTSGSNAKDFATSGNKITCCGGTLGALVTRGGTQFILSADTCLRAAAQAQWVIPLLSLDWSTRAHARLREPQPWRT